MKTLLHISHVALLRKSIACFLIFSMLFVLPARVVFATPTNPDVATGSAGVTQTGNTTNVDVLSSSAVINWDSLDTTPEEILQFVHDGGHFAVLNRVMQGGMTQFDGSLFGNQGTIVIVNPNGIAFGPTALVQAYEFTASALDIDNADFMNGVYAYAGDGIGSIENYGEISAEKVALIGKKVLNAGTISSPNGYTIMAAGDQVYLGSEDSDVVVEVAGVTVPEGAETDGLGDVINEGTIDAPGGAVIMAAGDTYSRAIEGLDTLTVGVSSGTGRVGQFGTINADGTNGDGGSVTMTAADVVVLGDDSVTTANAGENGNGGEVIVYSPETALFSENAVVEAKGGSESGDGGFVEVSGKEHVEIWGQVDTSAAAGDKGQFLIDPTNIIIDTSTVGPIQWHPGELAFYQEGSWTQNSLDVDTLTGYLAKNDVTVSTYEGGNGFAKGYIEVWQPITWSADTELTFMANAYINIDNPITNTVNGNGAFSAFANGNSYPGNINVNANVTAGRITMQAGNPNLQTDTKSNLTVAEGVTLHSTSLDTGLNIDLSARERMFVYGDILADHGDIQLATDTDNLGLGYVEATGDIEAKDGSVDISGRAVIVNNVYADENITLTGTSEVSTDPDFEEGGYVDAAGELVANNGDVELQVNEFDTVYNEDWDQDTYPVSDRADSANGMIYLGDNVTAGDNVKIHNMTEFYGEDDQSVIAEMGAITADESLTKTSESGSLYLHANQDVSLGGDVINEEGGVSVIADNGKIFTPGSNAINVAIEGYSDDLFNEGVDLPYSDGKAAIVLVSHDTLEFGPDASLYADGYYGDSGKDNRAGGALLDEDNAVIGGAPRDAGVASDIAIYAQSTTGDVVVNVESPYAIIVDNFLESEGELGAPTVVIDAYNKVLIPFLQTLSPAELQDLINEVGDDTAGFRLEVVSRVTEWLFQAIDNGTLPFAANPDVMKALLGEDYVLRGAGQDNPAIASEENSNRAWVLENPDNVAVPLEALNVPELKGCPVEMDAAATELAMNTDQLQLLIGSSLATNPNLQPCEACQKLMTAANILNDADGQRLAAMNEIFNTLAPADAPFTPEVQANITTAFANLSDQDSQYALANEYVDAFVNYVAAVGNDLQVPVGDPVAFAMERHGGQIINENPNIAAYLVAQAGSL